METQQYDGDVSSIDLTNVANGVVRLTSDWCAGMDGPYDDKRAIHLRVDRRTIPVV